MPQKERYKAVPRTLCFLRRGDRWLLLHRAADSLLWPSLYNGLGGHIEEGEGILESARRELREEAGIEAEDLRLAGVIHADEGEHGVLVFVFAGTAASDRIQPSAEGTPVWVTPEEALELELMPDLRQILPHLLAARPGDPPFLARSTLSAAGLPILAFEQ